MLSIVGFSQSQLYNTIPFPDTIPSKYLFDVKQEYKNFSANPPKGVKQRDLNRFAETESYDKQDFFTSGYVYLNWQEMEDYVNKIVQQILPDSLKCKKNIHVYITKDAELNAEAIHDGSIFMNIGLFADVVNEAGLAIILGHELTHYLYEDAKNDFLKSLKIYTKKNRNKNYSLRLNHAKYNRVLERRADSLGFILAENAGYDLFYGISDFKMLKEEEDIENEMNQETHLVNVSKEKNKIKDSLSPSLKNLLADHPDLSDRIDYLDKYLKSAERRKGKKDFIVDKELFQKFQQTAKIESLNIELSDNDFKNCAANAFVYYLFDPTNPNYIYYILESTRRAIYVEKKLKKLGFISDDFKKFKRGKGILHNLHAIIPDSINYSKIKCTALTDTTNIPFETYDEAFKYFSKIAIDNKINESLLTIALYYSNIDSLKNKYLKEYCTLNGVKYKDYATSLLKNSLYEDLSKNTKEIILLDNISFIEDHFYGLHNRLILSEQKSPAYIYSVNKMLSNYFPQYDLVEISKLNNNNLKEKMDYKEAIEATTFCFKDDKKDTNTYYFKNQKNEENLKPVDYFILNPEYWETFKRTGLKSINYLKIEAFDDKTRIVKLLNAINPCFWYFIMYRVYGALFTGSYRYNYDVYYYSFDINIKQPKLYYKQTSYKMTKAHLINTIYYAIKTKPKE